MYLYKIYDDKYNIIYIGKTIEDIGKRISGHLSSSGHLPIELFESIHSIYTLKCNSQYELMIKEILYIGTFKPKFNTEFVIEGEKPDKKLVNVIANDTWTRYKTRDELEPALSKKIQMIKEHEAEELNRSKVIEAMKSEAMIKISDILL